MCCSFSHLLFVSSLATKWILLRNVPLTLISELQELGLQVVVLRETYLLRLIDFVLPEPTETA